MLRAFLVIIACLTLISPSYCEPVKPAPGSIGEFFHGIVGEWVGVCKQSTNDQAADDKYFHVVITDKGSGQFSAKFEYFRVNDDGSLTRIGVSDVSATVSSANQASTRIVGSGELLVDDKPKKQEHDVTEVLSSTGSGTVEGHGTGTLKVMGMPLGLGKLGKVRDDQSSWSQSGATLSIHQSLSIVFRALCFSKSFRFDAEYTAVRGSNVYSQVPKHKSVLSKSGG